MAFSGCSHLQPLILVLLFLIPSAYQLSFSFSSFDSNNRDIEYEGDAFPINGTIKLPTDRNNSYVNWGSGRATYREAVQVGNKSTGTLIDFNTNFSFFVTSNKSSGDGLVFFLAANRFLPSNSAGECLGIIDCKKLNSSTSSFVAFEFDNYKNSWDPDYDHFGIDINSVISVVTGPWFPKSRQANARIQYNSDSKTLTVFLTYDDMPNSSYNIFRVLDLRDFLPEWVFLGFSASTGGSVQIHTIMSWGFNSTLATIDAKENITEPARTPTNIGIRHGSKIKRIRTIAIPVGVVIGVLVLVSLLIWFFLRKKRRRSGGEDQGGEVLLTDNVSNIRGQPKNQENGAMPINGIENTGEEQTHGVVSDVGVSQEDMFGNNKYGPKRFTYDTLDKATGNFREMIGEGAFGRVYKGFLIEYKAVAIKRFKDDPQSKQGIREFKAEVDFICELKHRNVVELYGYYHDAELRDFMLVYEFMHGGSLYDNLFNDRRYSLLLTWERRYKIALDVACGLDYLHERLRNYVVHRDIKSANILLDSDFRAAFADFGLARCAERGNELLSTDAKGTKGYLAPECAIYGQKPSKKSDVFSFGIVLLEITCGKRALEPNRGEIRELVEWVWGLYGKGKILRAVDKRLPREIDVQQVERLLVVGLWCAHPNPLSRPSIQTAFQVLSSEEAKLPVLPPKMPERTNPVASESSSSSSVEHSTKVPNNKGKNIVQDSIEEEDEDGSLQHRQCRK